MALGDYILCHKCECKLFYDGDRSNRDWWVERFGKNPEIYCPDCEKEREWVGLTDEDCAECVQVTAASGSAMQLIAAIEAKLKEKNSA